MTPQRCAVGSQKWTCSEQCFHPAGISLAATDAPLPMLLLQSALRGIHTAYTFLTSVALAFSAGELEGQNWMLRSCMFWAQGLLLADAPVATSCPAVMGGYCIGARPDAGWFDRLGIKGLPDGSPWLW